MTGVPRGGEEVQRPRPAAGGVSVSVVIATRNRAERLSVTLESLTRLDLSAGMQWEVLVVCNGCTDNSRDVVNGYALRLPITLLQQPRPGLSAARNLGVQNARGQVIAFIDDDIVVAADWLPVLWREFQSDPTLDGLGGLVDLYDSRDIPMTLQTWPYRTPLARGRQASLPDITLIPGCNMAYRRAVFANVGWFDEALGAGARHPAAEDTDFVYRALRSGCHLLYSPEFRVFHNHGRRTASAIRSLMRDYARGRGAFYAKHLLSGDTRVLTVFGRDVWKRVGAASRAVSGHATWIGNLLVGCLAGFGDRAWIRSSGNRRS